MLNILQTGKIKAKQANKLDVGKVNLCIIIIIIPTLSPLRITLPYRAPSPPLLHSTHVTTLHFTFPSPLPYPTNHPLTQLHTTLPSPLPSPTLPCPLPYPTKLPFTLPYPAPHHSTLPTPSPSHVLPFTVPCPSLRHSIPLYSPLPSLPCPPSYRTIPSPYSTPLYPPLPFYPNIHILP